MIAARERLPVIDGKRQTQGTSRSRRKLESGERVTATGDDRHHGPVAAPEHAGECFLIDGTRLGRLARMGVNPDPPELFGTQSAINLPIEELGDRLVLEGDRDDGTVLAHQHEVFDQQQIVSGGNPEAPDFGLTEITQEQQLGPRGRMEPE